MKSIKKRFRMQLAQVTEAAGDLLCLSAGIDLLQSVDELVGEVLQACQVLEQKVAGLKKSGFVEQIIGDEALQLLDEVVNSDLVSSLEERFTRVLAQAPASPIETLLQQILDKLEKKLVIMNLRIQRLGELLNEEEHL